MRKLFKKLMYAYLMQDPLTRIFILISIPVFTVILLTIIVKIYYAI